MRIAVLLDGLNQECVQSVLLDHVQEIRPLPEDVPLMLEAFNIIELNAGASDMEDTLQGLMEERTNLRVSLETRHLLQDIKQLITRHGIPNNYVFRVYPLPMPQVALVYTKEDFTREFYR